MTQPVMPASSGPSCWRITSANASRDDHGPADPRRPVDAVDRERVVGDDGLERVRDHLEHAALVERREQPLVDLEQAALALEPVVELLLLAADLPERLGVDHRLGGVAREDLEVRWSSSVNWS